MPCLWLPGLKCGPADSNGASHLPTAWMWKACSPGVSPLICSLIRTPAGVCIRSTSPTALPLASLSWVLAISAECAGIETAAASNAAAPTVPNNFTIRMMFLRDRLSRQSNHAQGISVPPVAWLIHRRPHVLDELARIRRQRREVADADCQIAQRPGIGEIDRLDSHALGRPPRRGRRHHADADIAFNQPADRVEASQLHAELEWAPDVGRLAAEEALNRAGTVETDKIVVEHVGKFHLGAARQRMILRHHQHEAVAAERIGGQPPGIDRAGDDADVT